MPNNWNKDTPISFFEYITDQGWSPEKPARGLNPFHPGRVFRVFYVRVFRAGFSGLLNINSPYLLNAKHVFEAVNKD